VIATAVFAAAAASIASSASKERLEKQIELARLQNSANNNHVY